jgi:hypothetical protein
MASACPTDTVRGPRRTTGPCTSCSLTCHSSGLRPQTMPTLHQSVRLGRNGPGILFRPPPNLLMTSFTKSAPRTTAAMLEGEVGMMCLMIMMCCTDSTRCSVMCDKHRCTSSQGILNKVFTPPPGQTRVVFASVGSTNVVVHCGFRDGAVPECVRNAGRGFRPRHIRRSPGDATPEEVGEQNQEDKRIRGSKASESKNRPVCLIDLPCPSYPKRLSPSGSMARRSRSLRRRGQGAARAPIMETVTGGCGTR